MKELLSLGATIVLIAQTVAQDPGQQDPQRPSASQDRILGGPEGVSQKLDYLDSRPALDDFVPFRGYFDWKARLKEEHGLSFGFSAYLLYQNASDTLSGDGEAFGGIYRFQGSWNAVGRGTGNPGRLEFRVEKRAAPGGWLAPQELGSDLGAAALNTGFAYSDGFDTDISVLNWTQGFHDQRIGVAVGRLSFDVYQDAFLFQTFSRGFLNRSFLVNPTIGTTGIGALGAVAKGFATDSFWLGGQIYDGNAVSGDFDLDTIEENEWLANAEIGWTPSIDRHKVDRVQFTYWHKDARVKAGVPSGAGWVVSASHQASEQVILFTRFGHSDGGAGVAAESAASVGVEYSPWRSQALSFGFGWADPASPALEDEYVFETSYKVQVTPQFSLTPDLQLLVHPANNPTESSVWVLGLRGIFAF
jgi:porin